VYSLYIAFLRDESGLILCIHRRKKSPVGDQTIRTMTGRNKISISDEKNKMYFLYSEKPRGLADPGISVSIAVLLRIEGLHGGGQKSDHGVTRRPLTGRASRAAGGAV
jgi:hypothetical protein